VTLSDLAALMGVTASTMSLAVSRLVAEGYVDRHRDPDDGRRVNLRLTPAGTRMKEAKSIFDPERVAALLGVLSPDERKNALEGLSLLSRAASDLTKVRRPDSRMTPAAEVGSAQLEE
jgi:DNA-binding MarR family transcriptional regulator